MMEKESADHYVEETVARLKELRRTNHAEFKRVMKRLYLQAGRDYQKDRSAFRSSETYRVLVGVTGKAPPEGIIALLVEPNIT